MREMNWRFIAELIGITAIVGSLIFVGVQLKQEQDIAFTQITQSSIEGRNELNIAMSEYADIWVKSNRGEDLTEEETIIMKNLVDSWYRRAIGATLQRRRLGATDSDNNIHLFAIQLYQNPGAARIWQELMENEFRFLEQLEGEESWLRPLHEEIEEDLAELKRLNPQ